MVPTPSSAGVIPGPAYFYLALPIYGLFGERGPALNLFALIVNCAAAIRGAGGGGAGGAGGVRGDLANDLYTLRCAADRERTWSVGVTRPEDGAVGMQTRLVFADAIASCGALDVTASDGDGTYAIAEIGFFSR